jgi:sterol desaturase/sphingolipid hydroxylase (fatty acid hydroxylase superfamily)
LAEVVTSSVYRFPCGRDLCHHRVSPLSPAGTLRFTQLVLLLVAVLGVLYVIVAFTVKPETHYIYIYIFPKP